MPVKPVYIVSIVVALAAISAIVYQFFSSDSEVKIPDALLFSKLSTYGYMEVSADAATVENVGVISLTGECYQLIANTELTQAESIYNGLTKRIDFRPNTHDLMKDAFDNLGIEVLMVKIVDLKDNTFIGNLVIRQENNIVSLDSRPSDGIAIAVRTGAPIYIKEDLMKSQGEYIC